MYIKKIMALVLVLNLLVSFNSIHVLAQAPEPGCCLNNDVEYCSDVNDGSECENFAAGLACNSRSECTAGCCVIDDACNAGTSQIECNDLGGNFRRDSSCQTVPECGTGGCILGDECIFTSFPDCREKTQQLNLQNIDFNSGMDQTACNSYTTTHLSSAEGCCVSSSGTCRSSKASECSPENFRGQECSVLSECSDCGESFRECVGQVIYESTSCGRERIVDRCDGVNTVCQENGDSASCVSADCTAGSEFIYSRYDYRQRDVFSEDKIRITSSILGGTSSRSNGDSWCMVSGNLGDPGSSSHVYTCSNGRVITNECGVFRDTICSSSSKFVNGRRVNNAACVPNNNEDISIGGYFYNEGSVQYAGGVDTVSVCDQCGRGVTNLRCGGDECRALSDCSYRGPGFKDRMKAGAQVGTVFAATTAAFILITGVGVGAAGTPTFGLPFTEGGVGWVAATAGADAAAKFSLKKALVVTFLSTVAQETIKFTLPDGTVSDIATATAEMYITDSVQKGDSRMNVRINGDEGYVNLGNGDGKVNPADLIEKDD